MRGPDPGPGGVVVLLTLRENQVLVQGLISPASNYEGTVKQAVNNRTFPCMEATYPYAIKNQQGASKIPPRGILRSKAPCWGLWMRRAGSLWHKRAGIATL